MKSYNIRVLSEADQPKAGGSKPKKPWIRPSVEMIALESAENGTNPSRADSGGGHATRPRS